MSDSNQNVIYGINGPVVTIRGATTLRMMEMVYVGNARLVGEVIGLDAEQTTIQVYEETTGLTPGEPVISTGGPMSVTLGPGIIRSIFDGIERPLNTIEEQFGAFIGRGSSVPGKRVGCDGSRQARRQAFGRRGLRAVPGNAADYP